MPAAPRPRRRSVPQPCASSRARPPPSCSAQTRVAAAVRRCKKRAGSRAHVLLRGSLGAVRRRGPGGAHRAALLAVGPRLLGRAARRRGGGRGLRRGPHHPVLRMRIAAQRGHEAVRGLARAGRARGHQLAGAAAVPRDALAADDDAGGKVGQPQHCAPQASGHRDRLTETGRQAHRQTQGKRAGRRSGRQQQAGRRAGRRGATYMGREGRAPPPARTSALRARPQSDARCCGLQATQSNRARVRAYCRVSMHERGRLCTRRRAGKQPQDVCGAPRCLTEVAVLLAVGEEGRVPQHVRVRAVLEAVHQPARHCAPGRGGQRGGVRGRARAQLRAARQAHRGNTPCSQARCSQSRRPCCCGKCRTALPAPTRGAPGAVSADCMRRRQRGGAVPLCGGPG